MRVDGGPSLLRAHHARHVDVQTGASVVENPEAFVNLARLRQRAIQILAAVGVKASRALSLPVLDGERVGGVWSIGPDERVCLHFLAAVPAEQATSDTSRVSEQAARVQYATQPGQEHGGWAHISQRVRERGSLSTTETIVQGFRRASKHGLQGWAVLDSFKACLRRLRQELQAGARRV